PKAQPEPGEQRRGSRERAMGHVPQRRPWGTVLKTAAGVSALATVYLTTAKLGLSLTVAHGNATPVWAPTGIAVAGLLVFGRRIWPGILIGAFLANATTPIPLWAAASIAVGNTLEAVVATRLLH